MNALPHHLDLSIINQVVSLCVYELSLDLDRVDTLSQSNFVDDAFLNGDFGLVKEAQETGICQEELNTVEGQSLTLILLILDDL
jgi:hypothetical protein